MRQNKINPLEVKTMDPLTASIEANWSEFHAFERGDADRKRQVSRRLMRLMAQDHEKC